MKHNKRKYDSVTVAKQTVVNDDSYDDGISYYMDRPNTYGGPKTTVFSVTMHTAILWVFSVADTTRLLADRILLYTV